MGPERSSNRAVHTTCAMQSSCHHARSCSNGLAPSHAGGWRRLQQSAVRPQGQGECSTSSGISTPCCSSSGRAPAWEAGWDRLLSRRWQRHGARPLQHVRAMAAAGAASESEDGGPGGAPTGYTLQQTQILVETAMLAAVGGLAYLLSTILKLEGSLGYFLPLPIVLAAMRGGPAAGAKTMMATGFLLVVLLGPLRSLSYVLIHGVLAAALGAMWRQKANFWLCVIVGACVRMSGQLAYLVLSSVTMNENLFAIMMSNVYAMLDQICASMGIHGAPSPLAITCMLFALLLVNASCYVFLLQIVYRIILQSMGYQLGPLPGLIRRYLTAGMPDAGAQAQR